MSVFFFFFFLLLGLASLADFCRYNNFFCHFLHRFSEFLGEQGNHFIMKFSEHLQECNSKREETEACCSEGDLSADAWVCWGKGVRRSSTKEPKRNWQLKSKPKHKPKHKHTFYRTCIERKMFVYLSETHFLESERPWNLFLLKMTEDLGQSIFRRNPFCRFLCVKTDNARPSGRALNLLSSVKFPQLKVKLPSI